MKSILCFCIFALISVNTFGYELTDKAIQYLAKAKWEDLPASVQLGLRSNLARAGGADHWCCVNEQPITTTTQTKIEHATRVVTTKIKVGYVDCGFLGTMKCSQYVTGTRNEMYTFVQTFQVPNMSACSSHEVKCCAGYVNVIDNCFTFAELLQHQELFQMLSGLGLLTSPAIGK